LMTHTRRLLKGGAGVGAVASYVNVSCFITELQTQGSSSLNLALHGVHKEAGKLCRQEYCTMPVLALEDDRPGSHCLLIPNHVPASACCWHKDARETPILSTPAEPPPQQGQQHMIISRRAKSALDLQLASTLVDHDS
jgi:hypothetical protein